jgi:zinc transport system permease protein
MRELLDALADPQMPFLRNAFLVGLLASVAFGVVGTYVVVRRISYLAGAIAHSVLGGIGAAIYAQRVLGWEWMHPMLGATVAALASAGLVAWATLWAREREDAVISAIWALGMGTGLLFLSATPGYVDPMAYLFGDVLLVGGWQVWVVAGLDAVVLALGLGLYRRFQAWLSTRSSRNCAACPPGATACCCSALSRFRWCCW